MYVFSCWISTEKGAIAAFIAPMVVIILVCIKSMLKCLLLYNMFCRLIVYFLDSLYVHSIAVKQGK